MVIIIWTQRAHKRAEHYRMRAVVKPRATADDAPFVVEREHTDATGGKGWVPANHDHATAIVCRGLLTLADALMARAEGRSGPGGVAAEAAPLTIGLGPLDLPE